MGVGGNSDNSGGAEERILARILNPFAKRETEDEEGGCGLAEAGVGTRAGCLLVLYGAPGRGDTEVSGDSAVATTDTTFVTARIMDG